MQAYTEELNDNPYLNTPVINPLHHNTPCPIHTWTRRLLLYPNSGSVFNFVFLLRTSAITKQAWMALGLASVRCLLRNSAWHNMRMVLSMTTD